MSVKIKRSVWLPVILAIYLIVFAVIGIKGLRSGETSVFKYVGILLVCIAVIVMLHFNLKKREQLRDERLKDISDNENINNKQ